MKRLLVVGLALVVVVFLLYLGLRFVDFCTPISHVGFNYNQFQGGGGSYCTENLGALRYFLGIK